MRCGRSLRRKFVGGEGDGTGARSCLCPRARALPLPPKPENWDARTHGHGFFSSPTHNPRDAFKSNSLESIKQSSLNQPLHRSTTLPL